MFPLLLNCVFRHNFFFNLAKFSFHTSKVRTSEIPVQLPHDKKKKNPPTSKIMFYRNIFWLEKNFGSSRYKSLTIQA